MRRPNILILLAVLQGLLLYLTASKLAGGGTLFGCTLLCGQSGENVLIPLIATAFGIALFVIPSIIGGLCRSWQGAIVLAVAPW